MSGVAARQVVVVGISNADELVTQAGTNAVQDAMDALRDLCVLQGVDAEHIRRHGPSTLLVRVDDLSCDEYLDLLRNISAGAGELFASNVSVPAPCVRVGAINERASRSLVNDAADTLLAYMSHYDSPIVFLAGDDASAWRGRDTTGIDLISNTRLKHIDPFTGLLCEKRFFELLGLALRDHELYGNTLSVLYLDIDDFKSYNRAFGYDEGNKLIQYMARQLREVFASDVVGYLSVDHFAVLSSAPDILRKCAAIHASVKSYSETFAPEVKCGIFKAVESVESPYEAVDYAKLACSGIKTRYDAFCGFFTKEAKEQMIMERHVARHAEQAVREGWIRTYAQPVMDSRTGELCGFEALARWHDPQRGILPPALFIPTLEAARLSHTVDTYMVDEVCHYLHRRMMEGKAVVPASVNVSRIDFTTCDVLEMVTASCERWNIPPNLLAVEVTEGAMDANMRLRSEMDRLRAAGYEVWMDDFGSGYSSLNLLKDYEFDVLKVDMEFLRDMEKNRRSKTIVSSILGMAKELGVRTLVEGVETHAHHEFLQEVGCDMMQGYLFGKPRPLKDGELL